TLNPILSLALLSLVLTLLPPCASSSYPPPTSPHPKTPTRRRACRWGSAGVAAAGNPHPHDDHSSVALLVVLAAIGGGWSRAPRGLSPSASAAAEASTSESAAGCVIRGFSRIQQAGSAAHSSSGSSRLTASAVSRGTYLVDHHYP
ncbi:unnamed protein product, partial [Urochloa humidicola]